MAVERLFYIIGTLSTVNHTSPEKLSPRLRKTALLEGPPEHFMHSLGACALQAQISPGDQSLVDLVRLGKRTRSARVATLRSPYRHFLGKSKAGKD